MSDDDELFRRVGKCLETRHGWGFEPSTTPGAAPSWCFEVRGKVELSVSARDGAVVVYVTGLDQDISFSDVDDMTEWIITNEGQFDRD